MKNAIVSPASAPAALARVADTSPLSADLVDAIRDYAEAARAENTSRAYRKAWERFEAWCASQGLPAPGLSRDRGSFG